MLIKMNVMLINCFMLVLLSSSMAEARTAYYDINDTRREDQQIDPIFKDATRSIEDCSASVTCPNGVEVKCSISGSSTTCGSASNGVGCWAWDNGGESAGGGDIPC